MSTFLYRLARWSTRRRRWVLAAWLLIGVGAVAVATLSGGKTSDSFAMPGTEAQQVQDLLYSKVPQAAGVQMQVVFSCTPGADLNDPALRTTVEQAVAELKSVPQVTAVGDPYASKRVSPDGRVAIASVQFADKSAADVEASTLDAVRQAVGPAEAAGIGVDYSGGVYPGSHTAQSPIPEIIGIAVALLILLITFGSFVAAGLPIMTAIIGVITTLMGVTAIASVVDIASAATTVALMLGLSCGVDYGLFILSRHRDNLLGGVAVEESIGLAMGTAGSSVVFAGLTVIVALCGLSLVGIPFLTVMGLSAAAAVAVAVLIAITLVPAMLGFAGHTIVRFFGFGRQERTARLAVEHPDRTLGSRWARFVVRHPVSLLLGGALLLAVIALPATSMELGLPSGSAKPTSDTQRRSYDLVAASFGPGFNGPLVVLAEGVPNAAAAQPIADVLGKEPGIAGASVSMAIEGIATVQVYPTTGPNDEATTQLVHKLRSERSVLAAGTGARILVGGKTASDIDISAKLSAALPTFLIVVIGLAFLLLTFAFRTILVPLTSILGFLLSVAAAFGAQVAIFQWGWGASLLGITPTQTVSFLPILMLAIIFGLSSDYEVFVVSRINEDFSRTGEARGSVLRGTGRAARVVTAAALIMFAIFVAFMLNNDPTVKAIGFSFAAGVFLDAFVVRLTLIPAVMALIGSRIWYHPRWFAKYIPDPDIEGRRLERPRVTVPDDGVRADAVTAEATS
ncbi:MAG: putative drug exporter of the superfamily [Nocardia sp.]|uniref:MMPL family transporter n=1 Tax=Nocardia sp. TaxID=1821 RepID=UPI0026178AB9|nr:MMPL family transporter [Nocardia sp.]MCU1645245.1 putative drug exporter of the superfamily [Nocardia sp.]